MQKDLTRRSFLKGAAATAISTALLGLSAQADETEASVIYTPGTYTLKAQGMER